ncbi:MAG: hypothetical protein WDZ37_05485 [Solirubrobacterales bacterium]
MPTTTRSKATDRLAELDAAVEAAQTREHKVKTDQAHARRDASATAADLAGYHEAVGAGEEPDAKLEARIATAARTAAERAADPAWQARARGAERARAEVESERDEFMRANFADLAGEEAVLDGPARDRLQAAYEELTAAEEQYAARVRAWHRYVRHGLVEAGPGNPLRGTDDEVRTRFARGIESPTPRLLLREEVES